MIEIEAIQRAMQIVGQTHSRQEDRKKGYLVIRLWYTIKGAADNGEKEIQS